MSRIGKLPVSTEGVEVHFADGVVTMKSSKGELSFNTKNEVDLDIADNMITVKPKGEDNYSRSIWGTSRSRLTNMVEGLTNGYTKRLEYKGVGYKMEVQGSTLKMTLGFSHPVEMNIPTGLTCEAVDSGLTISGIDKELVGQFASEVRKWRKPEPYLGKGIRYADEYVVRKQGKKMGA